MFEYFEQLRNFCFTFEGIQDTGDGLLFIYSLWDPSLSVQISQVVYNEPYSYVGRFGGEGTGYQFLTRPKNGGTGWNLNKWYTLFTRCWDHGPGSTYFGLWVFDSTNWRYLITMNYPLDKARFNYGATSFLENYAGTGLSSLRKMSTRNGWKRYTNTGAWSPFTTGYFDVGTTGGASGNTFYMATQKGLASNINAKNSAQSVPAPTTKAPVYPALVVKSFSANYNVRSQLLSVAWTIDPTAAQQFSYSIKIFQGTSTTSSPTLAATDSAPQVRGMNFSMSGLPFGTYTASLQLVDFVDVSYSPKTTTFTRSAGRYIVLPYYPINL